MAFWRGSILERASDEHSHHWNKDAINAGVRCRSVVERRSWCDILWDRSHMVGPLSYVSFQPVLHVWWNKGYFIWYGVKEACLLMGKTSLWRGDSEFFLSHSLSNHLNWKLFSVSLNKTTFLLHCKYTILHKTFAYVINIQMKLIEICNHLCPRSYNCTCVESVFT